jgi:hypothetical protein
MARQTSHVIVQPDDPPAPKSRSSPAIPWPPASGMPRTIAWPAITTSCWKSSKPASPCAAPRSSPSARAGQPQRLLRPHQGRRGVSAQRAYRSLFPRKHGQPRRHPHPQAAAAPRRGSQATLQDADQGPHAHPHRLYFRNGRVKCELAVAKGKQDWDKRETEKRREADREARAAVNASKHRMGR